MGRGGAAQRSAVGGGGGGGRSSRCTSQGEGETAHHVLRCAVPFIRIRAETLRDAVAEWVVRVSLCRCRPLLSPPSLLQFSVTEHFRSVSSREGQGLPGVFFFYELSPIMVRRPQRQCSAAAARDGATAGGGGPVRLQSARLGLCGPHAMRRSLASSCFACAQLQSPSLSPGLIRDFCSPLWLYLFNF